MLKNVPAADLPPTLKGKKPAEVEAYIQLQSTQRKDLQKQIGELTKQREEFIASERKKFVGKGDTFDDEVARILREEAQKKGLSYN